MEQNCWENLRLANAVITKFEETVRLKAFRALSWAFKLLGL